VVLLKGGVFLFDNLMLHVSEFHHQYLMNKITAKPFYFITLLA